MVYNVTGHVLKVLKIFFSFRAEKYVLSKNMVYNVIGRVFKVLETFFAFIAEKHVLVKNGV